MKKDKMWLGVLAGAAAGAIAGLLFAPGKGAELRSDIARRGKDTLDSLKNKASDLVDKVADNYMSGGSGTGRRDEGMNRGGSSASHLNSPSTSGERSFS